jgi:hypothetical protein
MEQGNEKYGNLFGTIDLLSEDHLELILSTILFIRLSLLVKKGSLSLFSKRDAEFFKIGFYNFHAST